MTKHKCKQDNSHIFEFVNHYGMYRCMFCKSEFRKERVMDGKRYGAQSSDPNTVVRLLNEKAKELAKYTKDDKK